MIRELLELPGLFGRWRQSKREFEYDMQDRFMRLPQETKKNIGDPKTLGKLVLYWCARRSPDDLEALHDLIELTDKR